MPRGTTLHDNEVQTVHPNAAFMLVRKNGGTNEQLQTLMNAKTE